MVLNEPNRDGPPSLSEVWRERLASFGLATAWIGLACMFAAFLLEAVNIAFDVPAMRTVAIVCLAVAAGLVVLRLILVAVIFAIDRSAAR